MNSNAVRPALSSLEVPASRRDTTSTESGQCRSRSDRTPRAEHLPSRRSKANEVSTWQAIIQSLVVEKLQCDLIDDADNKRANKRASRRSGNECFFRKVYVEVLERISTSSALVSWRDSTRCRYGSQMWHRSVSHRSGICALSGSEIRPGDSVYQPRTRPRALNASAMILSAHVECRRAP
jgi:hypothetical protein